MRLQEGSIRRRRRQLLLRILASVLAICAIVLAGAPVASAAPLDGVTGPVKEVAATVNETVEKVVPPVVTPPPPPAPESPPPANVPEAQVPEAPSPPPSVPKVVETAKQTAEAVTGTVASAAGTATSLGAKQSAEAEAVVPNGTANVQRTADGDSEAAELAAPAGNRPTVDRSSAPDATSRPLGSEAGKGLESTPARGATSKTSAPGVLRNVPVNLQPFVYVWPAIALLAAEGPLMGFVQRWSQAVLARYRGTGGGVSVLGASLTGGEPSTQPGDRGSPQPTPPPFASDTSADDSENPLLIFLLLIPVAAILFTLTFRYEEGHPVLPRRLTRWRR